MENKIMTAREWYAIGGRLICDMIDGRYLDMDEKFSSNEIFSMALDYEGVCGYEVSLSTLYKNCFASDEVQYDFDDLRNLCIVNDWFTCGTNEQYDKMFKMAEHGCTIHDLAMIIWICSENVSFKYIEDVIIEDIARFISDYAELVDYFDEEDEEEGEISLDDVSFRMFGQPWSALDPLERMDVAMAQTDAIEHGINN